MTGQKERACPCANTDKLKENTDSFLSSEYTTDCDWLQYAGVLYYAVDDRGYQGFAKQNYTMLDNLKLGYGGTKTEMERLLADAQKITGIHYDLSSLADVYNAIHVTRSRPGPTDRPLCMQPIWSTSNRALWTRRRPSMRWSRAPVAQQR